MPHTSEITTNLGLCSTVLKKLGAQQNVVSKQDVDQAAETAKVFTASRDNPAFCWFYVVRGRKGTE